MKNKTICFYDVEATSVSRDADIISIGIIAVTEKDVIVEDFIPTHNLIPNIGNHLERHVEIKTFYAEFTDFDINKCDNWVKENVVNKLTIKDFIDSNEMVLNNETGNVRYKGDKDVISFYLKQWLSQFESVEFWADFDVIDKPMLIDLIADWDTKEIDIRPYSDAGELSIFKIGLPKHSPNIRYDQFFDLHTLFKVKGVDTDINREEFSEVRNQIIPLPFSNIDHLKHNALWDSYVSCVCYEKLIKI